MSFNFEDDEFEPEYTPDEYAEDLPRLSDPIQERLDLASAYNALLKRGVFSDGTPATDKVEKEVQGFVRERLEVLMGVRQEQSAAPVSVFSDEEVAALKAFAARLKGPPAAPAPAPAPVSTPPRPTVKPVVAAPKPAVKPPAPKPPAPSIKTPKPRVARKPKEAAPPPVSNVSMSLDKTKKYPTPRSKEEAALVPDQEVFKVGPRYYMWRTNEVGTRYRVNVTPQAGQTKANDLYTAMPTGELFSALSAAQAEGQARQGKNALDMGGRDTEYKG